MFLFSNFLFNSFNKNNLEFIEIIGSIIILKKEISSFSMFEN
jgi:hypothetical protein